MSATAVLRPARVKKQPHEKHDRMSYAQDSDAKAIFLHYKRIALARQKAVFRPAKGRLLQHVEYQHVIQTERYDIMAVRPVRPHTWLQTSGRMAYLRGKALTACRTHYLRRVKSKRRPPVMLLLTFIVPPCSSTAFFTMASPSPVPPILRLRPLSTR